MILLPICFLEELMEFEPKDLKEQHQVTIEDVNRCAGSGADALLRSDRGRNRRTHKTACSRNR